MAEGSIFFLHEKKSKSGTHPLYLSHIYPLCPESESSGLSGVIFTCLNDILRVPVR